MSLRHSAPSRRSADETRDVSGQHVSIRQPTAAPPAVRSSVAPSRGPDLSSTPAAKGSDANPQPDADLVISYAAPGCVIAHVRNMTFSAWNAPPSVQDVEAFMALAQRLSVTYAQNSNVTLVLGNTELPGPDARASLEQLTAQYARAIHSVALVIDGAGFWASMIRSFLTGLHVLRGNGYRCKAFATPSEAAGWLLPPHSADTGVALTERELTGACGLVLARLRALGGRTSA
jgi:hypothetical protein